MNIINQTTTIQSVSATGSIESFSAIIGAIIGGIITLLGTAIIRWYRNRKQRIYLRRRLGVEMNMMVRDLEFLFLVFWSGSSDDVSPDPFLQSFHVFDEGTDLGNEDIEKARGKLKRFMEEWQRHFRTDVYDTSQQDLGTLKEEQILYIREFYHYVIMLSEIINNRFDNLNELDDEEFKEEIMDSNIIEVIDMTIDARERAIDAIGVTTITIYDSPYAVYEKKSENWSIYKKAVYWIGGYW